jgi:hypothetical protein
MGDLGEFLDHTVREDNNKLMYQGFEASPLVFDRGFGWQQKRPRVSLARSAQWQRCEDSAKAAVQAIDQ